MGGKQDPILFTLVVALLMQSKSRIDRYHAEHVLSALSVRELCVSIEEYVLDDQVPLSTMTNVIASRRDFTTQSHPLPGLVPQEIFEQAFGFSYDYLY